MNLVKQLIKFYINSSLHIAVSVTSMCLVTEIIYKLNISLNFYLFVFFSSVLGYNFIKYFGITKFHYRSLTSRFKEIQLLSFLSLITIIFSFFQLKSSVKLSAVILCFITFTYEIPFEKSPSLRKIKGLKVYIIALVWALTSVGLPLLESSILFSKENLITLFTRFLFVVVLMLPFEIRDLSYDDLNLSTIPQTIGVRNTKYLGFCFLIIIAILELLIQNHIIQYKITFFLILIITAIMLIKSNSKRQLNFTALWVEGIPILWGFSLWISLLF